MKTSIVTTLSLCLLYLCISNSQSLSSIETCNCESWDEECWDDCLSGQFAESNTLPCAKIKACQKFQQHHECKDVPITLPWRCGDRKTEFPCGFIRACQKHQQHPDCKDVPVQCRSKTPSPSGANFLLNVNVYLSSSWRGELSKAFVKAQDVLAHASQIFVDDSLERKILLYPYFIELDQDHTLTPTGLENWRESIPREYLKTGTLHMLFTANTTSTGSSGISYLNSICGKNNERASGIIRWKSNTTETAETFARKAAHTLGISHDFETTRSRSYTCGPGKWVGGPDNQIMNYGHPQSSTWSSCSNYDFKDYYDTVAKNGKFCLNNL